MRPRSRIVRRGRMRALIVLFLVANGAGCTGNAEDRQSPPVPSPSPRAGGEVVFGVFGAPPTLNPYSRRATDLTFLLARPVYPSLFRFQPDGSVTPELASSVRSVPGGVRVALQDWRWSNGRRLSGEDVVASVENARAPSGLAGLRARAVDRRTVELRGLQGGWRRRLATAAFVLPSGRPQGAGGIFGGPFVLAEYVPGLKATLRPNERWAGAGPYVTRVTVEFASSLDVLTKLLERRRLDAALLPSSINLDERLREKGIDSDEAMGWETIDLDFRGSGLQPDERAAVASAINRRAIERGLIRDDGRLSNLLHPGPRERAASGALAHLPFRRRIPVGNILVTAPGGDELLELIQHVIQLQLAERDMHADLALVSPDELYGGGPRDPGGVTLRRAAGIPRAPEPKTALRTLDQFPLFQVETVVAADPQLENVRLNPSIEGPLWNAEDWWWKR
jgi:ABC-type transport system substrate-binding protein